MDTPGHSHYNPTLRECVKKVPRLLGCEAAYYFPMDIDVCLGGELKAAAGEVEEGEGPSAGHGWKRRISDDVRLQGDVDDRRVEGEDGGGGDNDADGEEEKVGKLVLHVRSGDIFKDDVLWYYGQVRGDVKLLHWGGSGRRVHVFVYPCACAQWLCVRIYVRVNKAGSMPGSSLPNLLWAYIIYYNVCLASSFCRRRKTVSPDIHHRRYAATVAVLHVHHREPEVGSHRRYHER